MAYKKNSSAGKRLKTTAILQTSFDNGEVSPLIAVRIDISAPYNALGKAQNVIVMPQGGVTRRPGMRFIREIDNNINRVPSVGRTAINGGTAPNADDGIGNTLVTTTTPLGVINPYVIIEYDMGASVPFTAVDVCNIKMINGPALFITSTTDFFVQYTDDVTWVTFSVLGAIKVNLGGHSARLIAPAGPPSARYFRIVKTTATNFTTGVISLSEMTVRGALNFIGGARLMEFSYNAFQNYLVVFRDRLILIIKDQTSPTTVAAIPNADITDTRLEEINWAQSADTAIIVHAKFNPYKLVRGIVETDWYFNPISFSDGGVSTKPRYNFVPVFENPVGTITPDITDGVVKITASASSFTLLSIGQFIDTKYSGRARIIEFISVLVVRAVTIIPFLSTDPIISGSWVYESGWEDAWSDTRGWPQGVTFFQQRLWFGGTPSLPNTIWGSKTGLYFNFDLGQSSDDDAIDYQLDSAQLNTITHLYGLNKLQVLTVGGVFTTPPGFNSPITPQSFSMVPQIRDGAQAGIRPVEVDNGTVFVKQGATAIVRYVFDELQQGYSRAILGLYNSHLIKTPIDIAVQRGNTVNDATLLHILNSDGSLVTGTILGSENVSGFTPQVIGNTAQQNAPGEITISKLNAIGTVSDSLYAVVDRTTTLGLSVVNAVTLERFQSDHIYDMGVTFGAGISFIVYDTPVSGFNGLWVTPKIDGVTLAPVQIIGGVATFPMSVAYGEVGFVPAIMIETLPLELSKEYVRTSSLSSKRRRISIVKLSLLSTSTITLNGYIVTTPTFSVTGSNTPLNNFSGDIHTYGVKSDPFNTVTRIEQTDANPFTLLSVLSEVS